MRIALLTRSLDIGGTESQILALAEGLHQRGHEIDIISFYPAHAILTARGVTHIGCHSLNKRARWDILGFLSRLYHRLQLICPDVVYSFLPVPNIINGLMAPLARHYRVVWGMRASDVMPLDSFDRLTQVSYHFQQRSLYMADHIITNTPPSSGSALARLAPERLSVIPNGFDLNRYKLLPQAGQALRRQWGVAPTECLIGMIANFEPIKDHRTFLEAAGIAQARNAQLRFLCVGEGPCRSEIEARARIEGIKIICPGHQKNMAAVYSACDLVTLSSLSEGFPNALAEAMACERPCVSTDVGACRWLLDIEERLVPPGHAIALAEAWLAALASPLSPSALRVRIAEKFSLEQMISQTEHVFTKFKAHRDKPIIDA